MQLPQESRNPAPKTATTDTRANALIVIAIEMAVTGIAVGIAIEIEDIVIGAEIRSRRRKMATEM